MSAPRVLFVGPPDAGKSSLIAAFRAVTDEPADLRELDRHSCNLVLADPDRLHNKRPAAAVGAADAVILTVPAAATDTELDDRFRAFAAFLDEFAEVRTHDRAVAGLPVVLTLTKCDTLWRPGDDPAKWLDRVQRRRRHVREKFAEFQANPDRPAFGTLDVHTAATATRFPTDPQFDSYSGAFGVRELAEATTRAADHYRDRAARAGRRLRWTLTGTAFLISTLLAGLGVLAAGPGLLEADPLAAKIRRQQQDEGPPAARLADRAFTANESAWQAVRESAGFDRLPDSLKRVVADRLAEFAAYREYRDQFRPPRLGPNDVRTLTELDRLDAALDALDPPTAFAEAWKTTEAVKLRDKWRVDAKLVRSAEATVYEWYRGLGRRATALQFSPTFGDPWRADIDALIATPPPVKADEAIPGSPAVAVPRGAAQTYAPMFDFDRVAVARQDWEGERDRLRSLADATAAVGLAGQPGVLTGTDPATMSAAIKLPDWAADRFPDPARSELKKRYRESFVAAATHVRRAAGFTPAEADRPTVATKLLAYPPAWAELLTKLRRLAGDGTADPIAEAADFLRRDVFPATLSAIELTIPDDLRGARAVPAGPFVLTVGGIDSRYRPTGDPRRDGPATVVRYLPDGHPGAFSVRANDAVSAAALFRANGVEFSLRWDGFDKLTAEPVVRGTTDRGTGVTLTLLPPGGWPAMPLLLR